MRHLLAVFLTVMPAWACSCAFTITPCSVDVGSSAIFVAEVIVDSGEGYGRGPAKVVIVEPLLNVPHGLKEALIETSAGTSCYQRLQAGERYVIITDPKRYSVSGCSTTFRLTGNEHILDAMRNKLRGGTPRVLGSVRKSTGRYSSDGGIPDVTVELRKGESRFTATTDAEGRYVLPGLDPGRYQFRISKDGYVANDEVNDHPWPDRMVHNPETNKYEPARDVPGEIEVESNSCEIKDLAMWPDGSIGGTVRGPHGKPLPGVTVQAFQLDTKGERESSPLRTAVTDASGHYRVAPLPSGRYAVGVNARPYDDDNPYPPTLHAGGQPLYLSETGSVVGIDLVVPSPRKPARLRVKVLAPDGKPQEGVRVGLETPAGQQRWSSDRETDGNGELIAPVYIGEYYTVRVSHYSPAGDSIRIFEGTASVSVVNQEAAVTAVLQANR